MIEIHYADDDTDDLDMFREVVGKLTGHDPAGTVLYTYNEGTSLVAALRERQPEKAIVFLDINMPGKNGLQILSELRKEKHLHNLPVIIYSTSSDLRTINVSREMGATMYAIKPAYFAVMNRLVEKVISINWSEFKTNDDNFILCIP